MNEAIFAFERLTEEKLTANRRQINELSAPIVSIQEGIGVLPLIGLIDRERAQYLMEHIVPKIPSLNIDTLIVDFSGILMIDNQVADQLLKISSMLKLLGIAIASTGIRPQIAQAMIHEGVNLSTIRSYATVRQALEDMNKSKAGK
ncbi:STAS domain-containing protein [Planococcus sp. 107-1]|uniref:STAS domain-containing protein n=1 Tax=Planococcus sp. 107-1 TaxID=2908840 RepID=UPI001F2AADA4|nr:STAS domain-containing protein [Planococcus sp. 107-1]UJF27194.1 STAS domain-containing protein [Planococcus sp. 107-1]